VGSLPSMFVPASANNSNPAMISTVSARRSIR